LERASRELTLESNEKLAEMAAASAGRMTENLQSPITREEEILSMKMRIHNEVGASVLNTRRFFLGGCDPGPEGRSC
jgi:hypothetical protein